MHTQAYAGVCGMLAVLKLDAANYRRGLDLGGVDINGSVRVLLPVVDWVGLDIAPGPGVDIVADARTWEPSERFDLVLSTELLEHVDEWEKCLQTARKALRDGGYLILTCASSGRPPHSARGEYRMSAGEFYGNVDQLSLDRILARLFREWGSVYNPESCDLYAWGLA